MSHYFTEATATPSDPRDVTWLLPDGPLTLLTDRGVFGYGKVDTGTKLLLVRGPQQPASGDLLDLGCGTGAIAIALARRSPGSTVWAVDVNERARQLCRHNAARNEVGNVRVCTPDDVPAEARFSQIWSNPPIRVGKTALHELLLTWLARLQPVGEAWLTVQQHLGADSLQAWLTDRGYRTERCVSSAGFRILRVAAPVDEPLT
jgi:16S rRNA (guanine1207-N2)-methyltransferase